MEPILFTLAILVFCVFGRMENSVLGNALEGVPEESEEEEQPNNSNIESANNLDGQYEVCFCHHKRISS